jgi:biofilm protein TabA
MILDSLENAVKLETIHPLFKQAFDFLRNTNLIQLQPGKIQLDGDILTVSIMLINGKTPEVAKIETHQRYIDIQYVIEGTETMGWIPIKKAITPLDAYQAEKDIQFFADKPETYFEVGEGEFTVFFPDDGHAPGIANDKIKKAVIKILV